MMYIEKMGLTTKVLVDQNRAFLTTCEQLEQMPHSRCSPGYTSTICLLCNAAPFLPESLHVLCKKLKMQEDEHGCGNCWIADFEQIFLVTNFLGQH